MNPPKILILEVVRSRGMSEYEMCKRLWKADTIFEKTFFQIFIFLVKSKKLEDSTKLFYSNKYHNRTVWFSFCFQIIRHKTYRQNLSQTVCQIVDKKNHVRCA